METVKQTYFKNGYILTMNDVNQVYACGELLVESTMCDGKWLMRDRKVLTIDEEAIVKEAQERSKAVYKRAGIVLPDRFPTIR